MAVSRSEAGALAVAGIGHLALFGLLSVGFLATPNPEKLKPQPIEVAIADESALESAAPVLNSEPPKTQIAPEEGPVEPEATPPEPAPQPEPQPAPAPVARPQPPAPAPQPKAVTPKPTPPRRPTPPAPARPAPAKPAPAAPARPAPAKPAPAAAAARPQPKTVRPSGLLGAEFEKGLTAQKTQGRAEVPQASTIGPQVKSALGAEVIRQIKPHWTPPSGADTDQLRTRVVVTLNRDGSLAGAPRVTQTGVNDSNRSQAALHKERAIRAVQLAAPFKLPAQYYDAWKTIGPTLYEGL